MIVYDMPQGSPEWFQARLGMPTASGFHRIVTPAKLQYSAAAKSYIAELLAERLLGQPLHPIDPLRKWENALGTADMYASFTQRGTEMEAEARAWYEMERDVDMTQVGFITNDEGTVGGSPDGLVGDEGGLEIKCRGAALHVQALLGMEAIAKDTQVQGLLWLTGREWWDVLAYNPAFPPVLERHRPIPEFQAALGEAMARFLRELDREQRRLGALRDGRIDGSLQSALIASLRYGVEPDPAELSVDDIEAFAADVRAARDAGKIDDADRATMLDEAERGEWASVRQHWHYLRRELGR